MAWCPNCGDGYREDAKVCGWCGEALIPGPMPEREPEPRTGQFSGWELLCKVRATDQIALITGVLEGAQVPYMTWDQGAGQYLRIVMGLNAFGQEIYVPEDQLSQARDLLRAYYAARPTARIFEDDPAALSAAAEWDDLDAPAAWAEAWRRQAAETAGDEPAWQPGEEVGSLEDAAADTLEEAAQTAGRNWRTLPWLLLSLYWVIALLALAVGRVSTPVTAALLVLGGALTMLFARGTK